MDPFYAIQAGAGSSSSSAVTSDPYQQFYYWDTNANNWAFDYDAYYAAYGYPQNSASGEWSQGYGTAYPSQQASTSAGPSGWSDVNGSSNGAFGAETGGQQKEKKKKIAPGPKDANGNAIAGKLKKGETRTTVLRKGVGSQVYEDLSLLEWNPTHKRLFVGDLGNDVTDTMLARAFEKYPTFSKARVIRTKGTDSKSKGYGFVSFADPHDFLKAWKEMDGKYIGSRPCRLKKAAEDVNPVSIGARKDKLLAAQYQYDSFKARNKMGGAIGGDLRRHGIGKAWKEK